jgi:hypothetical protein
MDPFDRQTQPAFTAVTGGHPVVTVYVEPAHHTWSVDHLPDAGMDRLALPGDVARQAT